MICLCDQALVKDPSQTVWQRITNLVGKHGENARVRRFGRFTTGQGVEKRPTNPAARKRSEREHARAKPRIDLREALGE